MTQRTDDHLELLLSCLRPTIDEIDYTQVAAECDIVTAAAAMKRYQRLLEDHDIEDTITALADETREKNRTVELLLASIKSVNGALLVDYEELMEIMDNPPNTPHALLMRVRRMGEYFDLEFKSYHSKTWRKAKAQRRTARPKLASDSQKQKLRKKMAAFNKGDDGDEDESR